MRSVLLTGIVLWTGVLAVPAAAQTNLAAVPPDGTYTYTIAHGGQNAGSSAVTIVHGAGTLTVRERAQVGPQALASEAVFDPVTLREKRYRIDAAGQTVTVAVDGPQATLQAGAATLPLRAPAGSPSILVCDGLAACFGIVPAYVKALGGAPLAIATTLNPHAVGVAVEPASTSRPGGTPATDVATALSFDGGTATLWYDPTTLIVDIVQLPAAGLEYRLAARSPIALSAP